MADSVAEAGRSYRDRVRAEFEAAFAEDHTPHEVGASFGIGVFLTALPTLGLGLVAFVVLVAVFDRISKVAIFASVAVLNPALKPFVYLGSYRIGDRLLGTESIEFFDGGLGTATDATLRLLMGNVLLAAVLAAIGYVGVRRLTVTYRRRDIDVVERLVDPDP